VAPSSTGNGQVDFGISTTASVGAFVGAEGGAASVSSATGAFVGVCAGETHAARSIDNAIKQLNTTKNLLFIFPPPNRYF
jgi:hypothetical protein